MSAFAIAFDSLKKNALDAGFASAFGGACDRYFSAPKAVWKWRERNED